MGNMYYDEDRDESEPNSKRYTRVRLIVETVEYDEDEGEVIDTDEGDSEVLDCLFARKSDGGPSWLSIFANVREALNKTGEHDEI